MDVGGGGGGGEEQGQEKKSKRSWWKLWRKPKVCQPSEAEVEDTSGRSEGKREEETQRDKPPSGWKRFFSVFRPKRKDSDDEGAGA